MHWASSHMNSHIGTQMNSQMGSTIHSKTLFTWVLTYLIFSSLYLIFEFWHILTIWRVFWGLSHWLSYEYKKINSSKILSSNTDYRAIPKFGSISVSFLDMLEFMTLFKTILRVPGLSHRWNNYLPCRVLSQNISKTCTK